MADERNGVLDLARSVSQRLAGGALTPASAKLYSQHTRLDAGQPGLRWRSNETASRLEDAVRLVDAAFVRRRAGDAQWSDAMLRAAELLEWLSHPLLNAEDLPLGLLAASAYQLAGYPARAAGLLSVAGESGPQSGPLHSLLRGDFPSLLKSLTRIWATTARRPGSSIDIEWSDDATVQSHLRRLVEDETNSALGIVCAAMRWGTNDRVAAALDKLTAVAKFMLNGEDRYSWLLAKLVAETGRTFIETSLRENLDWLAVQLNESGGLAVERYFRQAYQNCKTQAWPSQQRGIEELAQGNSFVLCTPTGSGKTTVAEIAILQRLFSPNDNTVIQLAPLVMYLVPKRALAAEVEAKLLRTIAPLSKERVVITGLYGGIDWGPTDAWLTSDDRTVLICTYEKAEALIRFLGPLFLARLSLVVLDEAHMVQFDGKEQELRTAESRPLRLESLIARLLVHVPETQSRIIALSAVAAGMESTLAKWITGDKSASPAKTLYRSTRQLIGRLQCKANNAFDIRYDLLDRASLRFSETGEGGTPFVPAPFPRFPPAPSFAEAGPEKRLRPYLFWAAMHIVAPASGDRLHAVLVSIPQKIGGYAEDLLNLLEGDWADAKVPVVFHPPSDPGKRDKWQKCLLACEDYFGKSSREYRLLQKGIVVHHGKMPGPMARLLIQLVEEGVVHLILATSTLSEGVNLPFEVVLLPTLRRSNDWISARDFANLAGRAGRPGYGTEGRCLVLLPAELTNWSAQQAANYYEELIGKLAIASDTATSPTDGSSALAALLLSLRTQWGLLSKSSSESQFLKWLEVTATLTPPSSRRTGPADDLTETLDSLDSVLLAAIVEIESLAGEALTPAVLEERLGEIWRRCYAHYASEREAILGQWFLRRGQALTTRIYPDAAQRRRLYRSGLPPRLGDQLMQLYPNVRAHLLTGEDYAVWDSDRRFAFISALVELLASHPRFAIAAKTPGKSPWKDILRWWVDPRGPVSTPSPTRVSEWYDYVSTNFNYRFAWGIGCMLAVAANEAHGDILQPTTLDTWGETGLPWIALWLKELIVWGTLDPVAAYLLGRGRVGSRPDSMRLADGYYTSHNTLPLNEQLDPTTIRKWADTLPKASVLDSRPTPSATLKVKLERAFSKKVARRWRVLPAENGDRMQWVDPAGYLLAVGDLPKDWSTAFLQEGDFFLDVDAQTVSYEPYL
jgi:DEAD/DEAH box helicase